MQRRQERRLFGHFCEVERFGLTLCSSQLSSFNLILLLEADVLLTQALVVLYHVLELSTSVLSPIANLVEGFSIKMPRHFFVHFSYSN